MATRSEDQEDVDLLTQELERFFEARIVPGVVARTSKAVGELLKEHRQAVEAAAAALESMRLDHAAHLESADAARRLDAERSRALSDQLDRLSEKIGDPSAKNDRAAESVADAVAPLRKEVKALRDKMAELVDFAIRSSEGQDVAAPKPMVAAATAAGAPVPDQSRAPEDKRTNPTWTDRVKKAWPLAATVVAAVIVVVVIVRLRPPQAEAPVRQAEPARIAETPTPAGQWHDIAVDPGVAKLCDDRPCETWADAWPEQETRPGDRRRVLGAAQRRLVNALPACRLTGVETVGPTPTELDRALREAGICLRAGEVWPLEGEAGQRRMAEAMLVAAPDVESTR